MSDPESLEYYSEKFKYVLVDEYQDTNKAQFTLITILSARNGNIMYQILQKKMKILFFLYSF